MGQDDIEGGFVGGEELGDAGVDHLGDYPDRVGVDQCAGDDRCQSVKVGIFMCGDNLHEKKKLPDC